MNNPFKILKFDTNDREKLRLERLMKDKSWSIVTLVASGKLLKKDVDELQNIYNEYFKKFPDKDKEINCRMRITKLRKII